MRRDLLMSICNSPPASAAGRPKLALSRSVGLGDGKAKGEGPRGVADRLPAVLRGVLAALPRCCRRMWSDISCEQAWCPCITAQSSADQPSNKMQTKKSNYHSCFTCTPHRAWQLQEICNLVISLFQLRPVLHTVAMARKRGQLSLLRTCCVKWSKAETLPLMVEGLNGHTHSGAWFETEYITEHKHWLGWARLSFSCHQQGEARLNSRSDLPAVDLPAVIYFTKSSERFFCWTHLDEI